LAILTQWRAFDIGLINGSMEIISRKEKKKYIAVDNEF